MLSMQISMKCTDKDFHHDEVYEGNHHCLAIFGAFYKAKTIAFNTGSN